MQKKYYVVLDTNVLISGLLKIESYPGLVLKEILSENIILLINQEVLDEYTEVMSRPKFKFDKYMVYEFIEILEQYIEYVNVKTIDIQFNDEKDKVFYEIFKSYKLTNNVYLVTGNLKHFPKEDNIMGPKEFVENVIKS